LQFAIRWPDRVSALEPVLVEAELIPPPGVSATATVNAVVFDPEGIPYWTSELAPQEEGVYVSQTPLRLSLRPMAGEWRLQVNVQSNLEVEGRRELVFRPAPVPFRDLGGVVPSEVEMSVPQAFEKVTAVGDLVAGGRVWRYSDGAVELWWAPGPAEPMLLNNAIVMLEATHDSDALPEALDLNGDEIAFQGQPAFLFHESWPGAEGGPAQALVVQGPSRWLYVVRVRAWGSDTIPELVRQVGETFTFSVTGE